ncbi:cell wall anchor protein [Nocardiopsis sp. RSe5-2]|uniref:Cell wall anchor protein n=1 Tax=Nocardiopsis endophytica TaxID=3018445 RepID=A0ABT4U876_9ACTN|nr:cell wall anchor protein [Nocardiopsis endophytica]MDA2812931.1 cell wall anchor protein [Nocardiopsis endophytica]
MTSAQLWTLIGLGVFHGANPAMGWLLAVSRGLQEGSRAALLRSLPPLALGHAASIAAVAVVITVTGSLTASHWFTVSGGALLVALGLWTLLARRHFHWTDVRMSLPQLGLWSFFMASMHGAGLMVLPVLAGDFADGGSGSGSAPGGHHHGAAAHGTGGTTGGSSGDGAAQAAAGHSADKGAAPAAATEGTAADAAATDASWSLLDATFLGLVATGVHTLAMFAAAGIVALIAYDFLGVHAMRLRWVTMDRVWAFVLIAGGAFAAWSALA